VKKPKAFTLIELLVVVAIIALLISILLPSLSRARELSKRTVCVANERGLGQAYYIYAQDDPGLFPAIASTTTAASGNFQMFYSQDRSVEPSTTGRPSPSVDMWAVVKANNTTPKQYICPSTADTPDPAQDTTVYYDFYGIGNCSYGYQWQHSQNRRIIGTSSEPTFPVLADGNPYIKGGIPSSITLPADRVSSGRGNSQNHTNREGQNVLFQDGHANFEKGPDVGLSGKILNVPQSRGRDNCYSYFTSITATSVDPGSERPSWTPGGTGTVILGGKSDACLLP
jgi:prepilin-type N-terminal cleavage/methylation domain-containing protein